MSNATQILHSGKIYTLNPQQPTATAIAIREGKILQVGDDEEIIQAFLGAKKQHLGGNTIIPGLTDAHLHLKHYALNLQKVDCETDTRAECLRRVAKRARQTPPGTWILGHGWNQNAWPESYGSAADLDAVAPHHPVYLTAKSLHAAWGNSRAFGVANINAQTPDPPGGWLSRDIHGHPTGLLFENAMSLVSDTIPEPSVPKLAEALREAQSALLKMGLTGVHDFDRRLSFAALQTLHAQRELKLRVLKNIAIENLPHAIELGLRSGFGDDMLRMGGIKTFADGALGPQTAAMLEPYQGTTDQRGVLLFTASELFEECRRAAQNGLSMAIHAIGDRANRIVLDAYAQTRDYEREHHLPRLRHRIEHVQLIAPEDAARLSQLDVIASMQPLHATSDMETADKYWGERAAHSYAWQTMLQHRTKLIFGSDAPVEVPNPFWGIHAAVTRRRPDGTPGPEGWFPSQRLSVGAALRAYTSGPAYAAGMEDRLGMLAPGYRADLLVLEVDPFACPPEELRGMLPVATMVEGEAVG
ncbi:MAG: amidohydrolase [Chloroflexota bacterium]|nr:MAG: amidohydrolase [Chloroflexota bacterium]